MPRHLPALDGLRGIAVLLVLWCHVPLVIPGYPEWLGKAYWLLGPGGLGVEIFFVLSGFLITRLLLQERELQAPVRWFLLRRMLRIFPIYYLLLLVLLPFRPADELAWCAIYLHNVRSIVAPAISPIDHTWSLCIEEHFYLLWPLVVASSRPTTARRVLVYGAMPLAIGGAVFVAGAIDDPDQARILVQHASPFRFLGLGAGCLVAFAEPRLRSAAGRPLLLAASLLVASLALHPHLQFLFGPIATGTEWLPRRFEQPTWLVHSALLATAILLFAVFGGTSRRSPLRLLSWPPLRGVGRISYGLYLYHLPIYYYTVAPAPTLGNLGFAVAATFAVATLSWFLIERPLLAVAGRFRRPPVAERLPGAACPLPTNAIDS
jgi:peptidoglycan/LPS O-acetylase OafA/YrhL